jgi:hypothetical protein
MLAQNATGRMHTFSPPRAYRATVVISSTSLRVAVPGHPQARATLRGAASPGDALDRPP